MKELLRDIIADMTANLRYRIPEERKQELDSIAESTLLEHDLQAPLDFEGLEELARRMQIEVQHIDGLLSGSYEQEIRIADVPLTAMWLIFAHEIGHNIFGKHYPQNERIGGLFYNEIMRNNDTMPFQKKEELRKKFTLFEKQATYIGHQLTKPSIFRLALFHAQCFYINMKECAKLVSGRAKPEDSVYALIKD